MLRLGLLLATVGVVCSISSPPSLNSVSCTTSPLEVVLLFDVSPAPETVFEHRKRRVVNIVRHIEQSTRGRSKKYSLVSFYQKPINLVELGSPLSGRVEKLISRLALLHQSTIQSNSSSVARAIESAAAQFSQDGVDGAIRLVFLIHDGANTDLVAETLEAVSALEKQGATLFAVSAGEQPQVYALQGYAGERSRVLAVDADTIVFTAAIDEVTGSCSEQSSNVPNSSELLAKARERQAKSFGFRVRDEGKRKSHKFDPNMPCNDEKVDLMLLIDSSGSVFNAFKEEVQYAIDLLEALPEQAYTQNLQVSLVRFAADSQLLLPFKIGRSKEEIIETVRNIPFTGRSTRIAEAVEIGVSELEQHQRADARQIFLLISDGHGQEYWSVVQATGRKLQEADFEVFSVTHSRDFSFPELMLYAGDPDRIFVGARSREFIPTVSTLIRKCLANSGKLQIDDGLNKNVPKTVIVEEPVTVATVEGSGEEQGESTTATTTEVEVVAANNAEEASSTVKATQPETASPEPKKSSAESSTEEEGSESGSNQSETSKASDEEETATSTTKAAVNVVEVIQEPSIQIQPEDIKKLARVADNSQQSSEASVDQTTASLASENASTVEETKSTTESVPIEITTEKGNKKEVTEKEQKAVVEVVTAKPREPTTIKTIEAFAPESEPVRATTPESTLELDTGKKEANATDEKFPVPVVSKEISEAVEDDVAQVTTSKSSVEVENNSDVEDIGAPTTALPESEEEKLEKEEKIEGNPVARTAAVDTFKNVIDIEGSGTDEDHSSGSEEIDCDVDMVLVVDRSQSVEDDYQKELRTAVDTVNMGSEKDYKTGRIRVGAVSFARDGQVELPLEARSRSEVVDVVSKIRHTGGTTSAVSGFQSALRNLVSSRRSSARLVFILVSDGHSQDWWRELIVVAKSVQALPNSVILAVTNNYQYSVNELQAWTGNADRVFHSQRIPYFLERVQREMQESCQTTPLANNSEVSEQELLSTTTDATETEAATAAESEAAAPAIKPAPEPSEVVSTTTEPATVTEAKEGQVPETTSAPELSSSIDAVGADTEGTKGDSTHNEVPRGIASVPTEDKEKSTSNDKKIPTDDVKEVVATGSIVKMNEVPEVIEKPPSAFDGKGVCKVDIVFVIDASTSVEGEYQKQIQFAVDLVGRLASDDFSSRVHVGAITFNSKAQVEWKLGEITDKNVILHRLQSLPNVGGSTSVAKGMSLAVDEIEQRRRPDARQMIVLVSDGNSQDHWGTVISTANRVRASNSDVYAITVHKEYMFRELELYTGNKWYVYIDARVREFLDQAERSLEQCQAPGVPKPLLPNTTDESNSTAIPAIPLESVAECATSIVDLVIVLDTSSSVAGDFYKEKAFATDLIQILPEKDFEKRIAVSIVRFNDNATIHSRFGAAKHREDVLYELSRIEHTGGRTSLVAGAAEALNELQVHRRPGSRAVVVFVSDGNSQDHWDDVMSTSAKFKEAQIDVYAVTLSEKFFLPELKEYAGSEERVYVGPRIHNFIQEVGESVVTCPAGNDSALPTVAESIEDIPLRVVQRDSAQIRRASAKKCKLNKMDLQIIIDASSSREEVFEHQRELALSLVERLPVSEDGDLIAIGIHSFTANHTLRQSLSTGHDKKSVRGVIEAIPYRGGSTLTARAVRNAVDDLIRARRDDATQVVVLMNDGFSQDPWGDVLDAANRLEQTGAQRFGVALGPEIDRRELQRYIGDERRIYRDGSTEQFLNDVVSLLSDDEGCAPLIGEDIPAPPTLANVDPCSSPNLDIVVLFDNSDVPVDGNDTAVNANRYLILDVLGSLSANDGVRASIISMAPHPIVQAPFTAISEREQLFAKVEAVNTEMSAPAYAKSVEKALSVLQQSGRLDARSLVLIVGSGRGSADDVSEVSGIRERLRETAGVTVLAVDSSDATDIPKLAVYTGTTDRIYDYVRNKELVSKVNELASVANMPECKRVPSPNVHPFVLQDVKTHDNLDDKDIIAPPKAVIPTTSEAIEQTTTTTKVSETTTLLTTARALTSPSTSTTERTTTSFVPPTQRIFKGPKIQATPAVPRKEFKTRKPSTITISSTTRAPPSRPPTTRLTTRASSRSFFSTTTSTSPLVTVTTPKTNEETTTKFIKGCLLDVLIVLDSSGSVDETFLREKALVEGIINKLRIGPNNAKVALIKFAAKAKVKTVWSFANTQSKPRILQALRNVRFSSGTTAIHSALLQAVSEYTVENGARPRSALPIAIVFTDGFGQKEIREEAALLRRVIPNTFAVAINHLFPISRKELSILAGSPERVFTDRNIDQLHQILARHTFDCAP